MKNNNMPAAVAAACLIAVVQYSMGGLPAPGRDESLYIKAGSILTCGAEGVLEEGGILIREGKILRVDRKADPPPGSRILDFRTMVVIPGLIDAHTYAGFHTEDFNVRTDPPPHRPFLARDPSVRPPEETVPGFRIEPRYRAVDALYYGDPSFEILLKEGVTAAKISIPSDGLVSGLSVLVKSSAECPEEFVLKNPAGAEFSFSTEGNVMERYGDLKKLFLEALEYRNRFRKYEKDLEAYLDKKTGETAARPGRKPKEPKRDENREAVLDVLDGKILLFIRASRINEIQAALKIEEEFQVSLILVGALDAHRISGELSRRGIPVIAGPETVPVRQGRKTPLLRELVSRNVLTGFSSQSAGGAPDLLFQMAYAVQHGLTDMEALHAMTIHSARILGIDGRVGSIEPGKDADLVVLTGDPFRLDSRVHSVFVNGRLVHTGASHD